MKDIESYFPFENIRPQQTEVLRKITQAFSSGKRFVIVEGPTGFGKSPVAIALSRYYESAYIATPKKLLQDQYYNDFPHDMSLLKGKANYICSKQQGRLFEDLNCEEASCTSGTDNAQLMLRQCKKEECCPYIKARIEAIDAKTTLFNFANMLAHMAFNKDMWGQRDILIVDECHLLEDCLDSYAEIKLTKWMVTKTEKFFARRSFKTIADVEDFLPDILFYLKERKKELKNFLGDPDEDDKHEEVEVEEEEEVEAEAEYNDSRERMLISEFKKVCAALSKIRTYYFLRKNEIEVVVEEIEGGFCIKPLSVAHLNKLAFTGGERVLLMSATILDPAIYAESLGIKEDEYEYVSVPSTFPVENREIMYAPVGNMKASDIDATLFKMNKTITQITSSYRIANSLAKYVKPTSRLLVQERGQNQNELLQRHTESNRPTVLVSPSMV